MSELVNAFEKKVEVAKEAIQDIFGDTSVSQRTTIDALDVLRDEIDIMILSIESDLNESE